MKNRLIKLGGKEWNKDDIERVYISNDILNTLLKERGDECVYGTRTDKFYYDVKKNQVIRQIKGNRNTHISVEINFNN